MHIIFSHCIIEFHSQIVLLTADFCLF